MLFISIIIFTFWSFLNLGKKDTRLNYFVATIIVSTFFFASTDLFVGIPLYFWMLLVSIVLSLFRRKGPIINSSLVVISVLLFLIFSIQLINLKTGYGITKGLILNKSDTDSMELESELFLPTINFTVFKHFVFFAIYLVFVAANTDLLVSQFNVSKMIKTVVKAFHVLFVCLIVEFVIVNALGGVNDRQLMEFLFSFKSNQSENWTALGGRIYTVALCFNEPSYMGIIVIYYLLRMFDKDTRKGLFWDFLAVISCVFTWSSTAILISGVFLVVLFVRMLFSKKVKAWYKVIALIGLTATIIVACSFGEIIFDKLNQFIAGESTWGSAFFRRQSIEYALINFANSPIVGVGIGTIYCHSCLIQTLANIGILGFFLTILFHVCAIKHRSETKMIIFVKTIILVSYSLGFSMIQHFTSPILLISIFSVMLSENFMGAKISYLSKSNCGIFSTNKKASSYY